MHLFLAYDSSNIVKEIGENKLAAGRKNEEICGDDEEISKDGAY